MDVKLLINSGFLQQCGESITLDNKNGLIQEYNPFEGEPIKGMQHLNLGSIAKVCDTEIFTIELILKEIVSQIREQIKLRNNLRLMFKVGKLISQAGELRWKSFREENAKKVVDTESRYTSVSRYDDKNSKILSSLTRSILTPSVAKTRSQSHNLSYDESRQFHMANPNPQPFPQRFKGVRELGYK